MEPTEVVQMLATARKEAADNALERAGERLTNQTNNISKLRMEFFDRLVLLAGGTISLSFTLLGLLQKSINKPTHWHWLLFSSWGCFMASLVFAMIRNWREHDRLMATEWASYSLLVHESYAAFVQQAQSLGVETEDAPVQSVLTQGPKVVAQQTKKQQELIKATNVLGATAMILTVIGYLLLLSFAIKNAAALL
jgi:hypothetical protein